MGYTKIEIFVTFALTSGSSLYPIFSLNFWIKAGGSFLTKEIAFFLDIVCEYQARDRGDGDIYFYWFR